MVVSIIGQPAGSSFAAAEIDTPYQVIDGFVYYDGQVWDASRPGAGLDFSDDRIGGAHRTSAATATATAIGAATTIAAAEAAVTMEAAEVVMNADMRTVRPWRNFSGA